MAILVGYLRRKNEVPDGHQKTRQGWTQLAIIGEALELESQFDPPLRKSPDPNLWGKGWARQCPTLGFALLNGKRVSRL